MDLRHKPHHKLLGSFFLVVFVLGFSGALFFETAQPVVAQNADTIAELQREIQVDLATKRLNKWYLMTGIQAITSGMSYFVNRIAYDTAVWVASGGRGQKPLFITDLGKYLKNTSLDAVGEVVAGMQGAVDQLVKKKGLPGFDLCAPSLSIVLKLQLGLGHAVSPPTPRCNWKQLSGNWGAFTDSFGRGGALNRQGEFWKNVGIQFEPGQAPLGAALEINRQVIPHAENEKDVAKQKGNQAGGFLGKYGILSNEEKTPAELIRASLIESEINGPSQTPKTQALINAFGFYDGSVWPLLGRSALSTFSNTLITKLLSRVMGGFFSVFDSSSHDVVFNPEGADNGGVAGARQTFASLQTVNLQQIDNYNALATFTACPDPRGPENCVLDDQFAVAVRQADTGRPLTIREALDQGLIHGEWPLISPEDLAKNQDPNCDTYAYCYSNLVKMRKARIISVGWEMAAQLSPRGSPKSLKEVIDGFDHCDPVTKAIVTDDPQSPYRFCHLIDPNWILKYPRTQCRAEVPGPTLVTSGTDSRTPMCVDAASCVQEDDQGNCVSWGYCTREKNVWRFDGDACPAYFNTCQAFTGPTGTALAVRTNTVDFGSCTANNAGCRWLSTRQNYVDSVGDRVCVGGANDSHSCTNDASCGVGGTCVPDEVPFVTTPHPDTLVWQDASRVYLNRQAAQCDVQNAGCTELIAKQGAQAVATLNLVRNSSFEQNTDGVTTLPDFWSGAPTVYSTDFTQGALGSGSAVRLRGNTVSQRVTVKPNQFYTFSLYTKLASGGLPTVTVTARLYRNNRDTIDIGVGGTTVTNFSSTCTQPNASSNALTVTPTVAYARASCTFTTPGNAVLAELSVTGTADGTDTWVDALQFEESETMTAYGDGYNNHLTSSEVCSDPALGCTYLKVPPAACTGADNDPLICNSYAARCTAQDVGCTSYAPTNGDPAIPGIARQNDVCHASCEGYQTYREEPTAFNPNGIFPLYFIASSALQCSAANAGCDEFTQLGTGAGAETKQYYNSLRICEEESNPADTGTFHTWEGSETTGFQLRTWRLKQSQVDATVSATDPAGGRAPCVVYNAGTRECADVADFAATAPTNCNERADIFTNPDCREFYDGTGHIHYRLFSQTITKAAACTEFRKTPAGDQDEATCLASHGRYDTTTRQCFYRILPAESRQCSAAQNGCRLYTGNAGRNVQALVPRMTFEDATAMTGWTGGSLSTESLVRGEHSITNLTGVTRTAGVDFALPVGTVISGKTIFVEFWAKGVVGTPLDVRFGSAPTAPSARFSNADTNPATATAVLGGDWQFYNLGPVRVDWTVPATETLHLGMTGAPSALTIDNVVIKAAGDNVALIRNSWNTPAVCDATPEGAYSAQEMLGCSAYHGPSDTTVYLKSFSRLCAEKAIGCQAFFTTQNSSSPYAKTWNYICMRADRVSGACYVDPDGSSITISPIRVCDIAPGRDRCTFSWEGELVDPIPADNYATAAGGSPDIPLAFVNGTSITQDPDDSGSAGPLTSTLPFFYDESLTVVPGDATVYAVDAADKRCTPDAKGCTALGLPKFNQSLTTVTGYDDAARVNAPDTYDATLCTQETLMCEAWRAPNGAESYFKDPQDKQCEYKTSGPNGTFGWFKKGTQTCTLAGAASCATSGGCACLAGGKFRCTVDLTRRDCTYQEECYASFDIGGQENGIWTNRAVCTLTAVVGAANANCTRGGGCACPGNSTGTSTSGVVQCIVVQGHSSCSPYQGWAGACTSNVAACTEFIDPTDVTDARPDGENYDFIKNAKLDESSRPASEQCAGSVSEKEGCVLFNDTSEGALTWNAGATYLKSSTQNFAKVTPVSCAAPASGDAQFCRVCLENVTNNVVVNPLGVPKYCTDSVRDCGAGAHCPTAQNVPNASAPASDVNLVQKVRRDRECSRWLGCSSIDPVFDERTGTVRNVCSQLAEYVRPSGDVHLVDPTVGQPPLESDKTPAVPMTSLLYSRRDTSWHGDDYAGFSIPNMLPLATLKGINVGACVLSRPNAAQSVTIPESQADGQSSVVAGSHFVCNEDNVLHTDDCAAGSRCVPHFRLGRDVGPCNGGVQGSACIVGHCLKSDSPRVLGSVCGADPDCASEVCNGSGCPRAGQPHCSFRSDAHVGSGACYSNRCMQDVQGAALAVTDSPVNDAPSAPAPTCRAYPEPNAPFPSKLLVPISASDPHQGFTPIVGFQNAKFCGQGETCECSYQKITYDGGTTQYRSLGDSGSPKLCDTGNHSGESCTDDALCTDGATTSAARCVERTRSDRLLGLAGFCLEPDLSTNIWGDATRYACSTWMPIDRIPGTPDLFNQFADAGWNVTPGQEWYCAQGTWGRYLINGQRVHDLLEPKLDINLPLDTDFVNDVSNKFFDNPEVGTVCTPQSVPEQTSCMGQNVSTLYGGSVDCKSRSEGGIWCLWPQRNCPSPPWSYTGRGGSDSASYCITGIDRSGAFGGFNIVGCYEVRTGTSDDPNDDWPGILDSGIGTIHYPWTGPPIYKWQVKEFEVQVGDLVNPPVLPTNLNDTNLQSVRATPNYCGDAIHEGLGSQRDIANVIFRVGPNETVATLRTNGPQVMANRTNGTIREPEGRNDEDGSTSSLAMYPIWSSDNLTAKLIAMAILADDASSESFGFNITRFSIHFWPACNAIAYVGDQNGTAAFTDRLLNARQTNYTYPTMLRTSGDPYQNTTAHTPWGGICQAPTDGSLVINQMQMEYSNGAPLRAELSVGSVCSVGQTDALYEDITYANGGSSASLSNLFARSNDVKEFGALPVGSHNLDTSSNVSETFQYQTKNELKWDVTETADEGATNAPKVFAAGDEHGQCHTDGTCDCWNDPVCQDPDRGVLVNSQRNGDLSGAGQYRATAKFFMGASSNRMPITEVTVDWGDSEPVPRTGLFKNHLPNCEVPENSVVPFGLTSAACDKQPIVAQHDYRCTSDLVARLPDCDGGRPNHVSGYAAGASGDNHGGCKMSVGGAQVCVYVPRIHVLDNWGWCNGTCPGAPGGTGSGCYDGEANRVQPTSALNECDVDKPNSSFSSRDPWQYFAGRIIVHPL